MSDSTNAPTEHYRTILRSEGTPEEYVWALTCNLCPDRTYAYSVRHVDFESLPDNAADRIDHMRQRMDEHIIFIHPDAAATTEAPAPKTSGVE